MRLLIDHQTRYDYAMPANGIVQLLRLTPRTSDAQHVLNWRIDMDADGWLNPFTDPHGNLCHIFYAAGAVSELTLTVTGEVLTRDTAGILGPLSETLPPGHYLRATARTELDAALQAFAAAAAGNEPSALSQGHALMAAVKDHVSFDTDATHAATDAVTAFGLGRGVCQDISQIFIACARSRGIPARYVSGHYAAEDHPDQEASHAWAELWIDGLGWVGFDPTHGVCPGERHIRVAIGLDSLEASPVRGSRRGGGAERLAVTVRGIEKAAQTQSQG
ncbi:transglutaminase family protein [Sandaracinobacteroides saxicola]|uniref:Transglutaminase family protein n=1 Tax=Sandaracinobacteroides saxicola TaxID=2759707 RepID=A0A7G5IIX6_9SPHN|nr:transglutaminase family protein [Sandaracinobacteroides saxicola]QMW23318.1 transglutaminase family protein [Sandaracinobacteroides saxicola]